MGASGVTFKLRHYLAIGVERTATVGGMKWKDYWAKVCAPKLLEKKQQIGRSMSEREIAAAVETATGKPSERSLVGMWLHGEREPFMSQFLALCEKLEVDPYQVMAPAEKHTSRDRLIPRRSTLDLQSKNYKKPIRRTA